MKRLGCVGLSAVLSILTLAGCGQSDLKADTDTVYVEKNGSVLSMDVEAFDQEYYDEAELKEFVDSEVSDYNGQHGEKSVEVKDLSVEDKTAKLKLAYRTVDDYTAFTGVELYQARSCRQWQQDMTLMWTLRLWMRMVCTECLAVRSRIRET